MPFQPGQFVYRTPANQTATDTTTYENTGFGALAGVLGTRMIAGASGRALVVFTGDIVAGATAATIAVQLVYGTGTAPANNSAVTGTAFGPELGWVSLTAQLTIPFSLVNLVTGLTPGTDYYFDLACKGSTSTVQPTNVAFVAIEV